MILGGRRSRLLCGFWFHISTKMARISAMERETPAREDVTESIEFASLPQRSKDAAALMLTRKLTAKDIQGEHTQVINA